MTPARRQRIVARQDCLCAMCGRGIGIVDTKFEVDHVIPLELGGSDDDTNLAAICRPCHLLKTLTDLKAIAKARRLRKRADGTRRERQPIPTHVNPWPKGRKLQSRGFNAQYLAGVK